jgi:hypothetical protein
MRTSKTHLFRWFPPDANLVHSAHQLHQPYAARSGRNGFTFCWLVVELGWLLPKKALMSFPGCAATLDSLGDIDVLRVLLQNVTWLFASWRFSAPRTLTAYGQNIT